MKRLIHRFVLFFAFPGLLSAQTASGSELFAWVKGIEGRDHAGRQAYIKGELKKLGVKFRTFPFSLQVRKTGDPLKGENIVVSLGKGKNNIVVGAHLDAVPGSPGANDNGGGVAVVLGLIKSMKDYEWSHRIDFCFFDQEETGLLGSKEFVATYKDTLNHLGMINLDVEGTGEEVYIGPVGEGDDDLLMPLVRRAAQASRVILKEDSLYPSSDHLSFAERKLENISISVVPKGDAELLAEAVLKHFDIKPERMPKVMKVMHTPEDKSDYVSPRALEISLSFTKTILTLLNETTH